MRCTLTKEGEWCVCPTCGFRIKTKFDCDRVFSECKEGRNSVDTLAAPQLNGLGDRIEHWLSSYGLTQEKYKEVKQKFGLPATCGCDGRKEWFNKVGAYFGIDPDRYGPHKETK